MEDQLRFKDLEIQQMAAKTKAAGVELEIRLKCVGRSCERKDLAAVNDLSYSYLSEILNGSGEGKRFQVSMVPSLAIMVPDLFIQEIIAPLCNLAGYDPPKKKRELTPEEELRKLKRRIRDHGIDALFTDIL